MSNAKVIGSLYSLTIYLTMLHFLAIPFPLPGHILPMLQLCKKIAHYGVQITLVITERNHSWVVPDHTWAGLNIRLVYVPDELPLDFQLGDLNTLRLLLHACENLKPTFQHFMTKELQDATTISLPVSCIISDAHLAWTQDLADKFGCPRLALWTSNAAELCTYLHVPELVTRGCIPFRDQTNGFSLLQNDKPIDQIEVPGLPLLQFRDLPYLLRAARDRDDILFWYFVQHTRRITEAKYILVNTFYELEAETLDALGELNVPNVLPVGPLMLLGQEDRRTADSPRSTVTCEGEEAQSCLQWLDDQATSSVVYVAFGSVACIPEAQVREFAHGLETCGHPFLWVIRRGLAKGIDGNPLSEEYFERIKSRSLVVSWAPQAKVLEHPAVGCFLTHCGWNSALESICAGVPMACWPISADQPLTCKLIEDKWRIGLRIGEEPGRRLTKAEEVERMVSLAMKDETLKQRALQLQDKARKAPYSSSRNLDYILERLCQNIKLNEP